MSAPVIIPVERLHSSYRLTLVKLTTADITDRLGFTPIVEEPDRVDLVWNFLADGVPCAIWSFKRSHRLGWWSAFGPSSIFERIFGAEHLRPDPGDAPAAHTADAAIARSPE